jgi:DNA replication and repair protein RecF
MRVSHLSLTDFRSYAGLELPLEAGVTVLIGPNGRGKTNLVEAIDYVATLGSHRVSTDAPLVRIGAPRAVVRAAILDDNRRTLVELEVNPGKANRARLNRGAVSRPRDVLGCLRTVLFSPEDLALVKGDPTDRRRFLDDLLVARAPRYAGVRADYDRVLKQRNALLRSAVHATRGRRGAVELPTLSVWDAHLARAGAALVTARLALVAALNPLVDKCYAAIAGGGSAVLAYRSTLGDSLPTEPSELGERFLAALTEARANELDRGMTLIGPHRDELVLNLVRDAPDAGEVLTPAKGYASHGESWSYALALRLAAYELLRAEGGEPVLILDDVFAELDATRRSRLAELVAGAEQVLVTAAVPADVPAELVGRRVEVLAGGVAPDVARVDDQAAAEHREAET